MPVGELHGLHAAVPASNLEVGGESHSSGNSHQVVQSETAEDYDCSVGGGKASGAGCKKKPLAVFRQRLSSVC